MTAQRVVRGNCVLWALARRRALRRTWKAAGSPVGLEPALHIRTSWLEPRQVCGIEVSHWQVDHWNGTHWVREGWVPLDKQPLPWWRLWRALWADGEIVREELNACG